MLNTKEDFVECYQTIFSTLDFYMDTHFLNFSNYVQEERNPYRFGRMFNYSFWVNLPLRTLLFVKTPHLYKTLIFIFNQGLTELTFYFTSTFIHLADSFIQSDLQCIQAIHFFISMFHQYLNKNVLELNI